MTSNDEIESEEEKDTENFNNLKRYILSNKF